MRFMLDGKTYQFQLLNVSQGTDIVSSIFVILYRKAQSIP